MNSSANTFTEADIQAWALARIPEKRHAHVQGVVETADHLARIYAPDLVEKARIAAWLHDAAKHLPDDELLRLAEAYRYPIREVERHVPMLLHGVVGYFVGNDVFGFNDEALQTACNYHTAGHPDMNVLDQVVFVADLIEPTRDFNRVDELRVLAQQDLAKAMLLSVDMTITHIVRRQQILDERSIQLRNKLLLQGISY